MARRRENQKPNALVAAATNIKLREPKVAAAQAAKRQDWQDDAWAYFDEVPEIKESIRYRGNQLGKLRLYVGVPNPDDPDAPPIPVTDENSGVPPAVAVAAEAELARLRSLVGGQAEILRELDMNLEVAGECYLVGWGEYDEEVRQRDGSVQVQTHPENWEIRSISEVEVKGSGLGTKYLVKDAPGDKGKPLDPERDTIIRIWCRHPQWSNLPDSALRGMLGECRTLQILTQQVQAEANSRQSAGAFTVPNELSFGPADPTLPEDGDDEEAQDPFMAELQTALTEPIADPSHASSVMPMLIRGPGEYLKAEYLRHITFGRDASDSLEQRIDARLRRIFRGMNLPVEKVEGHQETTFANAAQVDEDEFNDYLRPSADISVEALTYAFLTPQLQENPAVPPEWSDGTSLLVWYDPNALIRSPDTEANADEAFQKGAISWAAYRKHKGYSEDDAPEPLELLQRAGLFRGILTAELTFALLEMLGEPIDYEPPARAVPPGGGDDTDDDEDDESVQAAAQLLQLLAADPDTDPEQVHVLQRVQAALAHRTVRAPAAPLALAAAPQDRNPGRELMELDRELRTRLNVAANDAMNRALERAGNRLRSKTNGTELRRTLRNVPTRHVYAHLGASLVAQVLGDDDPLDGAWDELEEQFMAWGGNAQDDAMELAADVAGGFSTTERDQLGLRQADDLTQAWVWMKEALTALAEARMFDPDPAAPDVGEFDPTLRVPTGLVRQALARAGGASGLIATDDGGAWLALTDAGTKPAGGIGTGQLLQGALRDHGALVEAYRWVYGPAFRARPFEPHRRLDGTVFQNFDDPVLANPSSFPPFAFYMPGDHTGCICDFEPIIVPTEQVT